MRSMTQHHDLPAIADGIAEGLETIPKPADRLDWLKVRHSCFNSSDAACLYDRHPFKDLGDVVADKLKAEPDDSEPTEAMERGTRLEPFVLDWWGDRHGVQVFTPTVLYRNGRLMATLDGEIVGDSESWIEAKTTSQRWDEVPEHVYWQVTAQAAASGKRGECFVAWIDADMRFKEARITPDPAHVEDVLKRAEQFMAFIDMGMVPEGVQLTAEHVLSMYPAPTVGKWVDLDDEGRDAVAAWDRLRRQRIDVEKQERIAKDEVARLLEDSEGAKYKGLPIATWRRNRPSKKPDWKALTEAHPDTVAEFTREVPGPRVLRTTKDLHTFGVCDD